MWTEDEDNNVIVDKNIFRWIFFPFHTYHIRKRNMVGILNVHQPEKNQFVVYVAYFFLPDTMEYFMLSHDFITQSK